LNVPPAESEEETAEEGSGHGPLRSSGSVDYLLDHEEEEEKRGPVRIIAVVIALVLAAGFGYLRFKDGGFDFLGVGQKKAAPANAELPQNSTQSAPQNTTQNPASSGTPEAASPSPAPATPDASASGASATAPVAASDANPAQSPGTALHTTPAPTPSSASPSDTRSGDESAPAIADAESKPQPPPSYPHPAPKPRAAKPSPAAPLDPGAQGESYVYGRGVPQDCDRGVRLLKGAAAQANPRAMITLGALYSAGTCTPRDLPTAYRWYALALHQEPDNMPLQENLKKLWAQMTAPERQLAIKLSQ
jgi:hypothetical protein